MGATVDDRRVEVNVSDNGHEVDVPFVVDRESLLALLGHLDECVLALRFDGTITFASPSVRTLLGWDERAIVGASVFDYLAADAVDEISDALTRWQGRRGNVSGGQVRVRAHDARWLDVLYQVTIDEGLGDIGDIALTFRAADGWDETRLNLVERARNEERLVRLASAFVRHGFGHFEQGLDEAIAELAGMAWVTRVSVWLVAGDRVVRRSTWAAAQGAPVDPLPTWVPIELVPRLAALEEVAVRPDRLPASAVAHSLAGSGVSSLVAIPMSVGDRFTGFTMVETTFPGPVFEGMHFATLRSASGILAQAFERFELERELDRRATTDLLTGLANRWAFEDDLDVARMEVGAGRSSGLAVALLDLDRLKVVNDSLGHEAGDQLLVEVARRLRTASDLRGRRAIPARLGGDEFLLLVRDCGTPAAALDIVTDLMSVLGPPFDVRGHAAELTASVGVVHTTTGEADRGELLRRADLAMYGAKARGGGRIELEDRSIAAEVTERVLREAELRAAVDAGALAVHYQGEWDLRTGLLLGAEALVRWDHPRRGVLDAAEFVLLAEESDLIHSLGMLVLHDACGTVSGWDDGALDEGFVIRVNVSARQLQDPALADQVAGVLRATGLAAPRLCLELTESSLLADPEGAAKVLTELRALGIGVAVDDFGTGFSSLLYLKQLPITSIKIDKAFVDGLPADGRDRAIVGAIVRLADELGITATAEGVETSEQVDALLDLGCTRAQGFFLSEPEPMGAFGRRLGRPD